LGLLQAAYKTYENNTNKIGVISEEKEPLTPVSHAIQNAQIEITISVDGEFQSAEKIPDDKVKTIIPVTIESAGRTSGKCAHPLCDQLCYIAPYDKEKFKLYFSQLSEWAESEYNNPKVAAIYNYIAGETIVKDLFDNGIIELNGDVPSNGKIGAIEYGKCLIRWRVIPQPDGIKTACWEDPELFDCYNKYFMWKNQNTERDICLITGEEEMLCEMHPKGVISNPSGAKLISANDKYNFTYRGRFVDSRQAFNVGYNASQKAHNALHWIAANYGVYMGGRTFICWNPGAHKVPGLPMSTKFNRDDQKKSGDFAAYKKEVSESLAGYKQNLNDNDDIVIAALEAATTGRLSVTYYNELRASDFMERIEQWYLTCCCDRSIWGIQSPSIRDIVNCAFGTFREDKKTGNDRFEADDKVLREHSQRLLNCVLEKQTIPFDIVHALAVKAGNLQVLSTKTREHLLFLTCAVIRKYKNEKQKREEWTLALDIENNDRSYLFGRLLAVAEQIERGTYQRGEERETNAIRMQSVFVQRPMYAWGIIEEKLVPYYARLSPNLCAYYKNLIGEIADKLPASTAPGLRARLEETYLLGYYQQRAAMFRKKEVAETNNDMEENENEHIDE